MTAAIRFLGVRKSGDGVAVIVRFAFGDGAEQVAEAPWTREKLRDLGYMFVFAAASPEQVH